MTHVVLESCIRCKYTDCVDVCPVDCFREGPNFLTIDPDECIDCAVCIPECPVNAIYAEEDVPADQVSFIKLNAELSQADGWKSITKRKPALPDAEEQREILEIITGRTERTAGRPLFEAIDYRKILPAMGGMSGADISEIVRRALETKVHGAMEGAPETAVSTNDLLDSIDGYKRVRGVVEKIRYGQYL